MTTTPAPLPALSSYGPRQTADCRALADGQSDRGSLPVSLRNALTPDTSR
ncbi:hypothetical protein [Streptomyces sp. NPDC048442]